MFVNLINVWLNDQLRVQKGYLNTVEKWVKLIDNWC